jgi:hypothetical protein
VNWYRGLKRLWIVLSAPWIIASVWLLEPTLDCTVEKLARAGIDPVQVFADEEDRLPRREPFELPQQSS